SLRIMEFKNCALFDGESLRQNASLLVKAGQFAGEPEAPSERAEDLGGRLVTPGLIDCHTHLIWGGTREGEFEERLEGATYQQIMARGGGIRSTVAQTRAASVEELARAAEPRLLGLMRQG